MESGLFCYTVKERCNGPCYPAAVTVAVMICQLREKSLLLNICYCNCFCKDCSDSRTVYSPCTAAQVALLCCDQTNGSINLLAPVRPHLGEVEASGHDRQMVGQCVEHSTLRVGWYILCESSHLLFMDVIVVSDWPSRPLTFGNNVQTAPLIYTLRLNLCGTIIISRKSIWYSSPMADTICDLPGISKLRSSVGIVWPWYFVVVARE